MSMFAERVYNAFKSFKHVWKREDDCSSELAKDLPEAFSASVNSVAGRYETFEGLHADMRLFELCEMVGQRFEVPEGDVRLVTQDQAVYTSASDTTLRGAGIVEGTELSFVRSYSYIAGSKVLCGVSGSSLALQNHLLRLRKSVAAGTRAASKIEDAAAHEAATPAEDDGRLAATTPSSRMASATTSLPIVEGTTSATVRVEKDEVTIEARPPTPGKAITEKQELNLLVNLVLAKGNKIVTGPEILMGPLGSSIALKHEILRLRALTTTTTKPVFAGQVTTSMASTLAEHNEKQLFATAQTSTTTSVEERALTSPESLEGHAVQVVEVSKTVPASLEAIVDREEIILADSKSDIAGTAARCNETRAVARVPNVPDSIVTADPVGDVIETDDSLSPGTPIAIPFPALAIPDTEDPSPASSVAFGMTDSTAFSVTVSTVTGVCETLDRLHADTEVFKLCELVAKRFGIPDFAVRLMIGGQVIHMSCIGMTLDMAGIVEGSELLLVKQFGWGKPDLRMLDDMEKLWRR
mmetsp:Transcript_67185/g.104970  ORF Transcript_67185/g.104970 Transcript_67185/m.104970 type:complete len:525 (+) Transcript_67185:60-1634(+)